MKLFVYVFLYFLHLNRPWWSREFRSHANWFDLFFVVHELVCFMETDDPRFCGLSSVCY